MFAICFLILSILDAKAMKANRTLMTQIERICADQKLIQVQRMKGVRKREPPTMSDDELKR
jgi:hypothetical protein